MTGAEGLAHHTGLYFYDRPAVALYAFLLATWAVTASCTLHGLLTGTLLPRS
ncbi:hypothetical protein [Streptomyces sp. NPDC051211]|uniref:hypothetical protein n=1 Tax=Streptomyces sp. NPDC051211 TaxID=3154643 RepID=UPI00344DD1D4